MFIYNCRLKVLNEKIKSFMADFREADHPRDTDGKFTDKEEGRTYKDISKRKLTDDWRPPEYNEIYKSDKFKEIEKTANEVAQKLGLRVKDVSINRHGGISAYIETPHGDIRISDHDTNYFTGSINTFSKDVNEIVEKYKKLDKEKNESTVKEKYFNDMVNKIKEKYTDKEIKAIAQNPVLSMIILKPWSGFLTQKFKGEDAEIIKKYREQDVSILSPFLDKLKDI